LSERAKQFFDGVFERPYAETQYAYSESPEGHYIYSKLKAFLEKYDLVNKKCLEIGTGYGQCQYLVDDYVGVDLAPSASKHLKKPFVNACATDLPFEDQRFDCVWSNHVLEHVPKPDLMLGEIWRVLKPGGYIFITATWQCGTWLAEGYPVRPFSDFGLQGQLIKLSVPIRKTVAFRSLKVFPLRVISLLKQALRPGPKPLAYTKLHPTYEHRWMADSTAEISVEPFDVYVWFTSRGAKCLNYPTRRSAFVIRTGQLTFQKPARTTFTVLNDRDALKRISGCSPSSVLHSH
jgi:SAM-dependent methyltransferase